MDHQSLLEVNQGPCELFLCWWVCMNTIFFRCMPFFCEFWSNQCDLNGTFETPPYKMKTSNFRGIVPIQFLINMILPIKWALDERYPTKLTFLCIMVIFTFSGNMANMSYTKKRLHDNYFLLKEHIYLHSKTYKIVRNIIL